MLKKIFYLTLFFSFYSLYASSNDDYLYNYFFKVKEPSSVIMESKSSTQNTGFYRRVYVFESKLENIDDVLGFSDIIKEHCKFNGNQFFTNTHFLVFSGLFFNDEKSSYLTLLISYRFDSSRKIFDNLKKNANYSAICNEEIVKKNLGFLSHLKEQKAMIDDETQTLVRENLLRKSDLNSFKIISDEMTMIQGVQMREAEATKKLVDALHETLEIGKRRTEENFKKIKENGENLELLKDEIEGNAKKIKEKEALIKKLETNSEDFKE